MAAAPTQPIDEAEPKAGDGWQFWIDVGGTFTDCVGRDPRGALHESKVLSSGAVKGIATVLSKDADNAEQTGCHFRVHANDNPTASKNGPGHRQVAGSFWRMPDDFFRGYHLRLLDAAGHVAAEATVTSSRGDLLMTAEDLPPLHHTTSSEAKPSEQAGEPDASVNVRFELNAGEEAPILAIRRTLGLRLDQSIGSVAVRLGTTRGTNALLERKGARVAFVTTEGFGDLLDIGTQARPNLFDLNIRKPSRLHERSIEVAGRIDAKGNVLTPLDEAGAEAALTAAREQGIEAVAICLINSYINPSHEERLAEIAERLGFAQVSVSSRLTATIKLLNRADTAVVDAYLTPVVKRYITAVKAKLPDGTLKLMNSAGGLVNAASFSGRDSILSGPAGGVVGFSRAAVDAGFERAIGFDMGGTSTDVSRFGGAYEYQFETEKAGVRVVAPMYAIETVAAGGGSICAFDGQRLTVGPQSAGADPGPACYGRGGPLTVTDINLFNGRLDPDRFPFPLDMDAVARALAGVATRVLNATGKAMSVEAIADGFAQIANQTMANAIKRVSAARGYDPAEHVLVSFGGAGAQHACAIADLLGIRKVLQHPMAGILSALGMGMADVRRFNERTVLLPLRGASLEQIDASTASAIETLAEEVLREGVTPEAITAVNMLDLRYAGEESSITVKRSADPLQEAAHRDAPEQDDRKNQVTALAEAFEQLHEQLYGHRHTGRAIEIVNARVEVIGQTSQRGATSPPVASDTTQPEPIGKRTARLAGETPREVKVFDRASLRPGNRITGPALINEAHSSIAIDPGWSATVTERSDLLLSRDASAEATPRATADTARDPVRLELFNNQFTQIATQMGVVLQRTSLSVNVKERLDFSCAILDAAGELVVNAPHIPVHLGAMGATVASLLATVDDLRPGDVYVCNDPALGGSHLPDITVMTPVFGADGKSLRFFTASRAHHAEVGGLRPGSAYPFAKNLAEEGVVFKHLRIARGGAFNEEALRDALTGASYPSRSPAENIADIRAQVAANHVGAAELRKLIDERGWDTVRAFMRHVRDAAAEKAREAVAAMPDGLYPFEDPLDDGDPVRVRITIAGDAMTIDFTGSAGVRGDSLNANTAIVRSAVLYCMRCVIGQDMPLNGGVLAPVNLVAPPGMLNPPNDGPPEKRAAVVGGNVELSQRVVDVVLGALGLAAASQGTMNNLVFGDESFGYYETICGGAGAGLAQHRKEGVGEGGMGKGSDDQGTLYAGADAVHTHMTNTRITDPEVLEHRYPVRLERFAIRRGSGGGGAQRGGDGVVRSYRFLKPLEVSLLTQRRVHGPFGLQGGQAGKPGRQTLLRQRADAATQVDPKPEVLPGMAHVTVQAGDQLTIETPGGGGYGTAPVGVRGPG